MKKCFNNIFLLTLIQLCYFISEKNLEKYNKIQTNASIIFFNYFNKIMSFYL